MSDRELAAVVLVAAWGLLVFRELWRQRQIERRLRVIQQRNQRFLDDLYSGQLVEEDTVFQTEFGSRYGLTVHTRTPEQAVEALAAKYLQPVRAA